MPRKISQEKIDEIQNLRAEGLGVNRISRITGVSPSTVKGYTTILERGFEGKGDYLDWLARQRGFESHGDYQAFRARIRGDGSLTDYDKKLARRKGKSSHELRVLWAIERGHKYYYIYRKWLKNRMQRRRGLELGL